MLKFNTIKVRQEDSSRSSSPPLLHIQTYHPLQQKSKSPMVISVGNPSQNVFYNRFPSDLN